MLPDPSEAIVIRTSADVVTHTEPHAHHTGLCLIAPEDLRRLNAELPAMREFIRAVKEGPQHDKQYRLWLLTVYQDNAYTAKAEKLPAAWSELVGEVVREPFRDWLSSRTGVDLEGTALEVNVSLREPGDFRNVHRGKTDRALNVVFVLNEQWPADGGGTYELWKGKDATEPDRRIQPVPGGLYTVVPSETSWHSVAPVSTHVPGHLLTLALGYSRQTTRS